MLKFFRRLWYGYIHYDVDKDEMAELLEIALKSGRRAGYDLNHAASCLSLANYRAGIDTSKDTIDFPAEYHARAEHYQRIFNAARDMKNYRTGLHAEICTLERRVETLEKIIEDHNIRTGENVLPFGPDDIPF